MSHAPPLISEFEAALRAPQRRDMPKCRIIPTPRDPACPFHATPGPVTLAVKDVVGAVMLQRAECNGSPVPGTPSKQITFTVVSGRTNLDVVYSFIDTENGEGELHEVCDGNTLLDRVHADKAAVRYTICE